MYFIELNWINSLDKCITVASIITHQHDLIILKRFREFSETEEVSLEEMLGSQDVQLVDSYFPIRSSKELKMAGYQTCKARYRGRCK